MTNVKKFLKKYPNKQTLDDIIDKIDSLDISNIKKLELKQKAKEKYEKDAKRKGVFTLGNNTCFINDTYMDELIEGWGRGA